MGLLDANNIPQQGQVIFLDLLTTDLVIATNMEQ